MLTSPPFRTKMGPQCKLGIYVGSDSPSIIRYLEPLIDDVFAARFSDCKSDETILSTLKGRGDRLVERRKMSWNNPSVSFASAY